MNWPMFFLHMVDGIGHKRARSADGCGLVRRGEVWYIVDVIQILINTIAIDTYKTITKLQQHGYTREQAEGLVEAYLS